MSTVPLSRLPLFLAGLLVITGTTVAREVVPPVDPEPTHAVPCLVEAAREVHPRLLFGPEDVAPMRAFYESEAGAGFREGLLKLLPSLEVPEGKPKFLTDATDGQRQGMWRLPTVALHYVLTGEKESLDRTVEFMRFLMEQPHWETGRELDSGMSAGNVMIGAALAFDWTYNDLDPAFREAFRDKLIYHARAMFHGGHMRKNPPIHYWQGDPANNHRWHRNAGMVLCTLAAYDGSAEQDWILSQLIPEMDFITEWLPDDGTSHEGPGYLVFGNAHLVLGVQAMDRCLGTHYLQLPYFANVARYFVHMLQPGMEQFFPIGDAAGGVENYSPFVYKGISVNQQADLQAAIEELRSIQPEPFEMFSWFPLLWYNPALKGGSLENLPKFAFFEDTGTAIVRDGWDNTSIGATFKCGPFGGYKLNEYRNSRTPPRVINVAHDDPDANSFLISIGGRLVAETDRYSKHKRSANHNTILVNGIGQTTPGEPEGMQWSQPGTADNSRMAVVTTWRQLDGIFAIEGEAAGSYPALEGDAPRPALERYRRAFIWVEGKYILVLDDIRAPEAVDLEWLVQGPQLTADNASVGRYTLGNGPATCGFQVVSTNPYSQAIVQSPADHRGKPIGWQQLRLKTRSAASRYASVYAPWGQDELQVHIETTSDEGMTVTVSGNEISDTWILQDGASPFEASTLILKEDGAELTVLPPAQ